MAQYAKTNAATNIFAEPDVDSRLVAIVDKDSNVAVIEHSSLWSKIVFNSYEGFCETENLILENGGDHHTYKESTIPISLPKDLACALYNALKFSLKL